MPGLININGNWHQFGQGNKGVFVRVGGSWRQISNGHVKTSGTWRRFYFSDNAGPGAATSVFSDFVNDGNCRVFWTNPADADFSYMHVECYLPGSGIPVWTQNIPGSPSTTYQTINTASNPYYTIQTWYITPYDTNGNPGLTVGVSSMQHTGAARGRTPSPITINPINSGAWNDGDGVSQQIPHNANFTSAYSPEANSYRPAAGFYSGVGVAKGVYHYGNQFYDNLRGANITGYSVALEYTGSGPFSQTMYGTNTPNGSIPFSGTDGMIWSYPAPQMMVPGSTDFYSVERINYNYVSPPGIANSFTDPSGSHLTALAFFSAYPPDGAGGGYFMLYRAYNEGGYYVRSGAWSISHDG